ncbi:MAG: IS110 family transposase [Acidobacteria bacterium]|nr:IS110 family transposase [Acidobacteriota bacterium]
MPRRRTPQTLSPSTPGILQPNAAGVDVGATEIYIAVPADRDSRPVRCFRTFTADLNAAAEWLQQCRIESVAMESTGVYWIPFFQILEAAGFEVFLVNARHVKNVPGRKTDVADCQWLQYLHSAGLLRGSFRPPQAVCTIRSILRHREGLVQIASTHVQHMQKALDQMNLQLHHVISDITGLTGTAIVEAILKGERDPAILAKMRDRRIKASEETIAAALIGDYRPEHLFTLRQSLAAYRHCQQLVAACDVEIEQYLTAFDSKSNIAQPPLRKPKDRHRPRRNELKFDLRGHLYRIFGVDLTEVPGLNALTVHVLFSEIGPDLSRFANASAFASWLGLCPDNRISGGKILSVRTRVVKNRVAMALRMAAQSLHRSQSYLGNYYRRMRTKLGTPKAITAAAHKLARILYQLVTSGQSYDESTFSQCEIRHRIHLEANLRRRAHDLGFDLVRPST